MAREKTPKRYLTPDAKYNSVKIAQFINYVMKSGRKAKAIKIVYDCLESIHEKTSENPLTVFEKAIGHVAPKVEVKSRRVGGANLPIPIEVRPKRQFQLFLQWVIQAAHNRKKKDTIAHSLAKELIEAANGEGGAMKRKMHMDKSAQSHKAYSHLK